MKNSLVIGLVLLGICLTATARKGDTTKELVAVEQKFNDALVRSDWKAVEQMYADDLVFTNADGSVTHKSDEIATIKSGDEKLDFIEMSDVKVQDLGDVAVTTGRLVEKGRYKTEDLGGTYRYTDVWAKRNGRWQLVAGQETRYTPAK
jgi:ketosteroid isomerase-like protein